MFVPSYVGVDSIHDFGRRFANKTYSSKRGFVRDYVKAVWEDTNILFRLISLPLVYIDGLHRSRFLDKQENDGRQTFSVNMERYSAWIESHSGDY